MRWSPPHLFGHEIVAIMCGLIWGPWIGFAIVAAGTILGESLLFFVCKYGLRKYMDKAREQIQIKAFGNVVEQEGFKVILAARYSSIPPHFSTFVFAAYQVPFWKFFISAFLSLPRQLAHTWLGYDLSDAGSGKDGKKTTIITYVIIGVTVAVTIAAMQYLSGKIKKETEAVIYQRRKARQAKAEEPSTDASSSPDHLHV